MQREAENFLLSWRLLDEPVPLLLRGARQVGKSYLIESFAKKHFESSITINFELEPEYKEIFANSIEPDLLIAKISTLKNQKIIPGKTLLFFDEIQLCPRAILSLRYFYEKKPGLHVAGAGSLLDFVLNSGEISIPVGRIQYLFLKPLSFYEYLRARHPALLEWVKELKLGDPIEDIFHKQLEQYLREYFIVGGMPKAISTYIKSQDLLEVAKVHDRINLNYRDDFAKYAKQSQQDKLQTLFLRAPKLIGQKFKYSAIDPDLRSHDLKLALDLLISAGLISKIKRTSGAALPLEAEASEKIFKVAFLDIGLIHRAFGFADNLSGQILASEDYHSIAAGKLAEQFVAQELSAQFDFTQESRLYFWQQDSQTNAAEVDFLFHNSGKIFPLEVKAGTTGRLKSMHIFIKKYSSKLGIRISQKRLELESNILSLPFYMIPELPRLLRDAQVKL